jgi:hypothetical protein
MNACGSTPPAVTDASTAVADLRTTLTEVVTGLGMFGFDDVDAALAARPESFTGVTTDVWEALARARKEGRHPDVFEASFINGRRFLDANDALRGRLPMLVEWKGAHRAPGDEVVPADLRVDHVYLVSCKYLSRIVVNASPHNLFERLLAGGQGKRGGDWFRTVAADAHDALYAAVRNEVALDLPDDVTALDRAQRKALAHELRAGWPEAARAQYATLVARTADASAQRWHEAAGDDPEAMLRRLLRIGSAPYFVLGASAAGFVRLRIATPWDWRQAFELRAFEVEPRTGGQPMVAWRALVREKSTRAELDVCGHVEIRWSHGRFCGPPEAKVYLDTPHERVPGYFALR